MNRVGRDYDQDFYAWTQTQAALLREGKASDLDHENLADEIESLGKRDRRELGSRLEVLVMHLLKWRHQPAGRARGSSWGRTIRTQRTEISALLADSPSLRPYGPTLLALRYPKARQAALEDMALPEVAVPGACPWSFTQVLDEAFWPEGDGEAG
jgi:hypothetical protein